METSSIGPLTYEKTWANILDTTVLALPELIRFELYQGPVNSPHLEYSRGSCQQVDIEAPTALVTVLKTFNKSIEVHILYHTGCLNSGAVMTRAIQTSPA